MPASLPGQSHYCVLLLLHSVQDSFTSTEQNVDLLTLGDRKVAQRNLHLVEFMGVPPPPSAGMGMWAMLHLNGYAGLIDLAIDATRFPGTISLVLPPPIYPKNVREQAPQFRVGAASTVAKWIKQFTPASQRLYYEAKFRPEQYRRLTEAMKKVASQKPLIAPGGKESVLRGLPLNHSAQVVFLRIDPPAKARVGDEWIFDVYQRNSRTGKAIGGSRYKVVVNRKT